MRQDARYKRRQFIRRRLEQLNKIIANDTSILSNKYVLEYAALQTELVELGAVALPKVVKKQKEPPKQEERFATRWI
jgi:hypothetical protein